MEFKDRRETRDKHIHFDNNKNKHLNANIKITTKRVLNEKMANNGQSEIHSDQKFFKELSSPNSPTFQRALPAPPGFLPDIDRSEVFPTDSLEFSIINRAFIDVSNHKSSVVALSTLCEDLKKHNMAQDVLIQQKDDIINDLTLRLYQAEDELVQYETKLKESIILLKQRQREISLLKGSMSDKDQFIENSVRIKKEHNLEIPILDNNPFESNGSETKRQKLDFEPSQEIEDSGGASDSEGASGSERETDQTSNDGIVGNTQEFLEKGYKRPRSQDIVS